MTQIAEMLACLHRIEARLAEIVARLADVVEKPKIERQSVGLNQRIRSQLRRLRHQEPHPNDR